MKKLLTTVLVLSAFATLNAQSYEGKGDSKLNVGYEIYGIGPGIKASYDYGLSDLWSVGAGASYYFDNEEQDYFIYARTNLHLGIVWDLPRRLDLYPGVELGFKSSSEVGITGYVGVRYCITKKMSLFAEIGNHGAAGISFDV
jgi:hypothetical protein